MRIRIAQNAGEAYKTDKTVKTRSGTQLVQYNYPWRVFLDTIAGEWLTVETDHLFDDQFNTRTLIHSFVADRAISRIPESLKGTSRYDDVKKLIESPNGHRIMEYAIDAIENDARIGKLKCGWCGFSHNPHDAVNCEKCGKPDAEYNYPLKSYFKPSAEGRA
jgi:hypothetical protein